MTLLYAWLVYAEQSSIIVGGVGGGAFGLLLVLVFGAEGRKSADSGRRRNVWRLHQTVLKVLMQM